MEECASQFGQRPSKPAFDVRVQQIETQLQTMRSALSNHRQYSVLENLPPLLGNIKFLVDVAIETQLRCNMGCRVSELRFSMKPYITGVTFTTEILSLVEALPRGNFFGFHQKKNQSCKQFCQLFRLVHDL